jgi:nitrate reductase gamma subunit
MNLSKFVFAVYPYIALAVFVVGSWVRYDHEQCTWKTESPRLLSSDSMVFASNVSHIGILSIFAGHVAGLVLPQGLWLAMGISDMQHQRLAISAGSVFGLMCFLGGTILWFGRMFDARARAASRTMDIFIPTWLMVTLILGISTIPVSVGHANHNNPEVMLALSGWVQSVLTLSPRPELLDKVDAVFKTHMFFGMTVFLLFPFTRLVHVLTAPLTYVSRACRIIRTKRRV